MEIKLAEIIFITYRNRFKFIDKWVFFLNVSIRASNGSDILQGTWTGTVMGAIGNKFSTRMNVLLTSTWLPLVLGRNLEK